MDRIYTFNDLENIQKFVRSLKHKAKKLNIKLEITNDKFVNISDNIKCGGYFESKNKYSQGTLATATGMEINKWLIDDLNSRFGDRWISLFKRWFEMNTGLTVYDMITENVISESVDKNTKKINLLYSLIEDELKKYSWFESFEVVEEPYDWRGKVIPNYVFKIKEYSEDWGDDINELYDEIDFIFTMLFPPDNGNPIALWDIKYI